MGWASGLLSSAVDVGEAETPAGRALLEERYRTLLRQIPLLYAVALANYLGLYLATGGEFETLLSPSTVLISVVCLRLVHWVRARNRPLPAARVLRELRKTWCFALLVSFGFSAYAQSLIHGGNPEYDGQVITFGTLAAIGCAYGLSSFPAAARLPVLILGLPLATRLIALGDVAHVGMGISIAVVLLLILHLLHLQNRSFCQLVGSRSAIAAERERAQCAEKQAKAEKVKARLIADTDPLTGLANRRAFLRALGRRAGALPRTGATFSLAMIDLDGFKPINDTFGHATGDAVLKEVGARITAVAGSGAHIARTGGDEFALLLPYAATIARAETAGAALCATLAEAFCVDGREFRISGCCGITLLTPADCNPGEALIRADTALYSAKENGRSGVAIYSAALDEIHRRRSLIEQALRRPETKAQIALVYQPISDLATGEVRAPSGARRDLACGVHPCRRTNQRHQGIVRHSPCPGSEGSWPLGGNGALVVQPERRAALHRGFGDAHSGHSRSSGHGPAPPPGGSDGNRFTRGFLGGARQSSGAADGGGSHCARRFRCRPCLHLLPSRNAVRRDQAGRLADRSGDRILA
jgi:diguanylate cyclase (GGDEF)-like protein